MNPPQPLPLQTSNRLVVGPSNPHTSTVSVANPCVAPGYDSLSPHPWRCPVTGGFGSFGGYRFLWVERALVKQPVWWITTSWHKKYKCSVLSQNFVRFINQSGYETWRKIACLISKQIKHHSAWYKNASSSSRTPGLQRRKRCGEEVIFENSFFFLVFHDQVAKEMFQRFLNVEHNKACTRNIQQYDHSPPKTLSKWELRNTLLCHTNLS